MAKRRAPARSHGNEENGIPGIKKGTQSETKKVKVSRLNAKYF